MTVSGKGRIFISYRRTDSAGYAGRIFDRLSAHFGAEAVFMDVDTIEAGLDFVEVLQNAVQSCDVLVALIGRSWLNIKDEAGKRRLDSAEDFVRVEITAALRRNIRVIPVLVDGASMPHSTELPNNLKPLARRNALQVNHHSFNTDAQRLISQLELALRAAENSRILKARRLQEEGERKEREAREAEERKRTERREQKERARLAAVQQAKKGREERMQKEAEEKARKKAQRRARQAEATERIKDLFPGGRKLPIFIGSGIVVLVLLGYILKSAIVPSTPSSPTEISAPLAVPSVTDVPHELGVGSTLVSVKDGMVMVYVHAGEFQMGSEDGKYDEKPIHTVKLDAFWIDRTEVTNAMYAKCVAAGECNPPSATKSHTRDSYYGNAEFDDYPVIFVSWNDAAAYCDWAGRRLPTDAEWEKAAGWDEDTQAQRVYPWGNTFDGAKVNFCDTNCSFDWKNSEYDDNYADTAPVGSYPAGVSFYGAYDMAGNVWEWVSSLYQTYPYIANDGREDLSASGSRVLRGGAWDNDAYNARSANRYWDDPAVTDDLIGFRCSRSP